LLGTVGVVLDNFVTNDWNSEGMRGRYSTGSGWNVSAKDIVIVLG